MALSRTVEFMLIIGMRYVPENDTRNPEKISFMSGFSRNRYGMGRGGGRDWRAPRRANGGLEVVSPLRGLSA